MRRLATEASRHGANTVIRIHEVWLARPEDLAPYQSPSESPTRKEALALVVVNRPSEPIQYPAEIVRDADDVSLDETAVVRGGGRFLGGGIDKVADAPPLNFGGAFDDGKHLGSDVRFDAYGPGGFLRYRRSVIRPRSSRCRTSGSLCRR